MASVSRFSPEQVSEPRVTSSTVTPGNWRKASLIRPPQPVGQVMPVTSKLTCANWPPPGSVTLVVLSVSDDGPLEFSPAWQPKASSRPIAASCLIFITLSFVSRNSQCLQSEEITTTGINMLSSVTRTAADVNPDLGENSILNRFLFRRNRLPSRFYRTGP